MPVTVSFYNHTALRERNGGFPITDSFIVNLYTVLPFNATATTKTAAESGATQLSTANGYTQNAKALAGVALATVNTKDCTLTFSAVNWDATGAGITASFGMIYDDTQTNDPPHSHIDFGGSVTAVAGSQFRINPNAAGYVLYDVP